MRSTVCPLAFAASMNASAILSLFPFLLGLPVMTRMLDIRLTPS